MSTDKEKFYITTSIPYLNAAPHLGFALEALQADAIARYQRLSNKYVFFLTGSDEHGAKIARAAELAVKNPQEFIDEKVWSAKDIISREYDAITDFMTEDENPQQPPESTNELTVDQLKAQFKPSEIKRLKEAPTPAAFGALIELSNFAKKDPLSSKLWSACILNVYTNGTDNRYDMFENTLNSKNFTMKSLEATLNKILGLEHEEKRIKILGTMARFLNQYVTKHPIEKKNPIWKLAKEYGLSEHGFTKKEPEEEPEADAVCLHA